MKIPEELNIEITKKCNYNCPYCYCVWHENPRLVSRELPISTWQKIIESFVRKGGKRVMFTGGEPLLKKGFLDLLDWTAQSTNLELSIFTNGSRINDSILEQFQRCNVSMGVSLQGITTYGDSTGTKRNYLSVLEVLMRANELNIPLSLSTTITQINKQEASQIVLTALAAGAESISVMPFMFDGKGWKNPHLSLSWAEWEEIVLTVQTAIKNSSKVVFGDEMVCNCREFKTMMPLIYSGQSKEKCDVFSKQMVIGPSGQIRHCLHLPENIADWKEVLL